MVTGETWLEWSKTEMGGVIRLLHAKGCTPIKLYHDIVDDPGKDAMNKR